MRWLREECVATKPDNWSSVLVTCMVRERTKSPCEDMAVSIYLFSRRDLDLDPSFHGLWFWFVLHSTIVPYSFLLTVGTYSFLANYPVQLKQCAPDSAWEPDLKNKLENDWGRQQCWTLAVTWACMGECTCKHTRTHAQTHMHAHARFCLSA